MHNYLIREAFTDYSRKMERIFNQLNLMKESYSFNESKLLMEGFWDKVKSAAAGVGSFLGKTTKAVSDFSKNVYDKGVELGKKAVEVGKELINKISTTVSNAVEYIKKTPGRIWDACTEIYSSVTNEVGEIWKKAKEKGGEFIKTATETIKSIYNTVATKISTSISTFIEWAKNNKEQFLTWLDNKKTELVDAAKSAANSANQMAKAIGEKIMKFFDRTADIMKSAGYKAAGIAKVIAKSGLKFFKIVGMIAIGCIALPFIGAAYIAKKTYQLGEEAVEWTTKGLESIKNNCQETWAIFSQSFQKAAEKPVAEGYSVGGGFVKTFEEYTRRNY